MRTRIRTRSVSVTALTVGWLSAAWLSAGWLSDLMGQQVPEAAPSVAGQAQIDSSGQRTVAEQSTAASPQSSDVRVVALAAQSTTESKEKADSQKATSEEKKQSTDDTTSKARGLRLELEVVRPGIVLGTEEKSGPEDTTKSRDQGADKDRPAKSAAATIELRVYEGAPSEGDDKKAAQVTSITIIRVDGQPSTITVRKGDKEWTIKDWKLDDLPADVRAILEKHKVMVDRFMFSPAAPLGLQFQTQRYQEALEQLRKAQGQAWQSIRPFASQQEHFEKIEKQLQQVTKTINELTEEIRELRKSLEEKKE